MPVQFRLGAGRLSAAQLWALVQVRSSSACMSGDVSSQQGLSWLATGRGSPMANNHQHRVPTMGKLFWTECFVWLAVSSSLLFQGSVGRGISILQRCCSGCPLELS